VHIICEQEVAAQLKTDGSGEDPSNECDEDGDDEGSIKSVVCMIVDEASYK
jgi:hypothetical protein